MNSPLEQTDDSAELNQAAKPQRLPILRWLVVAGLLLTCIGAMGVNTQPASGGPVIILVTLLLFFLLFLQLSFIAMALVAKFFNFSHFTGLKKLYMSILLASGGVFLIGLQTLSQLQLADLVLVVVFEVLLNFYITRRF